MAKVVVLGLSGEEGLWIADLEAGTVVPMSAEDSGKMQPVMNMRKAGTSINRGVDFAVSIQTADDSASGLYEAGAGLYEAAGGLYEAAGGLYEK